MHFQLAENFVIQNVWFGFCFGRLVSSSRILNFKFHSSCKYNTVWYELTKEFVKSSFH